ncbi:Metallo-dependent phosphatase-like protein [Aspergillus varians]
MLQTARSLFHPQFLPFQALSDLHLEINQQYQTYEIPARAKHLILAGDIGRLIDYDNYRDFLRKQTDQFERVFLVLGNHEFYNGTFDEGLQKARQLETEPSLNGRLVLLHRRRYDVPGSRVTILGCTLWSNVPGDLRDVVRAKIQDFKKIRGWGVDEHIASHGADLDWLLNEIQSIQTENEAVGKKGEKRSILVVTHHAPSLRGTSSPQHADNPWRFAFGTDVLGRVSGLDAVKAWVFGHTHYSTEFKEAGVRVMSNQRGYVLPWSEPSKREDGFDVEKVIYV